MELILVRHAEPFAVTVVGGGADPGLTALGTAQAQALALCPAVRHLDAIVQSEARRAIETARPIAEQHGLVPITVPGLVEFDWGAEDYTPIAEIRAANDHRWQAILRGEPFGEVDVPVFRQRV